MDCIVINALVEESKGCAFVKNVQNLTFTFVFSQCKRVLLARKAIFSPLPSLPPLLWKRFHLSKCPHQTEPDRIYRGGEGGERKGDLSPSPVPRSPNSNRPNEPDFFFAREEGGREAGYVRKLGKAFWKPMQYIGRRNNV